jgi:hypothetical protein
MKQTQLLTPLLGLALAASALASGSAPTRPPRIARTEPATETMDNTRYALGKAIFNGKAPLHSNPRAARQQRTRLSELAARSGRSGASLPTLAGKLSSEQLDALEYYVAQRYGGN